MSRLRFPNCEYGPFQLRRLFRARFLPGERIIGWGPAMVNPPVWMLIAVGGMVMIPIVGHALFAVVLSSNRRMVLLTDSRLLVLSRMKVAGDPEGRGIKLDVPVHAVEVKRTRSSHRFTLTPRGGQKRETLSIETRLPPGQRLVAGLAMLADPVA